MKQGRKKNTFKQQLFMQENDNNFMIYALLSFFFPFFVNSGVSVS